MKTPRMTYFLIAVLFAVFIVLPEAAGMLGWKSTAKAFASMRAPTYGILHWPSFWFIVGAWFLLNRRARAAMSGPAPEYFAQQLKADHSQLLAVEAQLISQRTEALCRWVKLAEDSELVQRLTQIIRRGGSEDDIKLAADLHLGPYMQRLAALRHELTAMVGGLPMLGMVGTIAGLMFMFSSHGSAEDFAAKFSGLATALLTTLYASLLTVLVVKPKLTQLAHVEDDLLWSMEQLVGQCRLLVHQTDVMELDVTFREVALIKRQQDAEQPGEAA